MEQLKREEKKIEKSKVAVKPTVKKAKEDQSKGKESRTEGRRTKAPFVHSPGLSLFQRPDISKDLLYPPNVGYCRSLACKYKSVRYKSVNVILIV